MDAGRVELVQGQSDEKRENMRKPSRCAVGAVLVLETSEPQTSVMFTTVGYYHSIATSTLSSYVPNYSLVVSYLGSLDVTSGMVRTSLVLSYY